MKPVIVLALVAVLAAAGCGGSSKSSSSTAASSGATTGTVQSTSGGGGTQLTVTADPSQLKFDQTQLAAKPGKVTITMTNQSPLQHDIALKGGVDAKGKVVGQGGTSVVTADLKPGKYTFYCSVDGHEAAGMTGTLTVG
jgi:plastocyanin